MNRRSPKRWARPRSRRWRDDLSPSYGAVDILKELWSDGWERPAWAKVARKFGWLTAGEFYAVKMEDTGRRPILEAIYTECPLFKMLKKQVAA